MDYEIDRGVEILRRTPDVIASLIDGLSPVWLDADEGAGTWSPVSVLAHLIHGERADWIARARMILEHGADRTFVPFDRFAHLEWVKDRSPGELLAEFRELRDANLRTLEGWRLKGTDLDRGGRHPDLGPVTLRQLLATWAVHDLGHIGQMVRVMAKQYRDAVGPWEAYLPVLHR